jgi:hypothetical protein
MGTAHRLARRAAAPEKQVNRHAPGPNNTRAASGEHRLPRAKMIPLQ